MHFLAFPPSVAPWPLLPACPRHHLDKLSVALNAKKYPKRSVRNGIRDREGILLPNLELDAHLHPAWNYKCLINCLIN